MPAPLRVALHGPRGWLVALLLAALPAQAHRLAPSLLQLEQLEDGRFQVLFKTPLQRPAGAELRAELPPHCAEVEAPRAGRDAASLTLRWVVDCGGRGLAGESLGVRGLAASSTNALVRVAYRDGPSLQGVIHAAEPRYRVPESPSPAAVLRDYLRLGAEHIATGFDHLLFVFGLLLLSASTRALVATVTAFTLGHSVTLSLAVLGLVRFPTGPIELVIAVSIGVLALELARRPPDPRAWLRRRPWTAAAGFGLLHGLGFAGALAEVGLPQQEIPLALLSFNLGIEVGQLAFVAGVTLLRVALRPVERRAPAWLAELPVTAMGALAVYWCLERAAALI